MFDNRGSNLRYRRPMPFEQDNFQITPANLHEYLNMCRPKRNRKYHNSGIGIEQRVDDPNRIKKNYISEQRMVGSQLNEPQNNHYHSTSLKRDTHYSTNPSKLPQRLYLDYNMGIGKIKPNSTANTKRNQQISLNKDPKVNPLSLTTGPAGIKMTNIKNGGILKLGGTKNIDASEDAYQQSTRKTYFKTRNHFNNNQVLNKSFLQKKIVRNQSESSLLELQLLSEEQIYKKNEQQRFNKSQKQTKTTPIRENGGRTSIIAIKSQKKSVAHYIEKGQLLSEPAIVENKNGQQKAKIVKICAAECFKGRRPYNQDRYLCLVNCRSIRDKMSMAINNQSSSNNMKITQLQGRKPNEQSLYSGNQSISGKIRIRNVKVSETEEKSLTDDNNYDLYGVFDGHGGAKCSQFIKDNLYQILSMNKNVFSNPVLALKETIHRLQQKFIALSEKKGSLDVSGSCAVVTLVKNNQIYVANVGDSRALIMNSHQCKQITKDHKPDEAGEKMRIIKHGGKLYKDGATIRTAQTGVLKIFSQTRIMPGSLNVSRTIGDIETKIKKYGGSPGIIICDPQIFVQDIKGYSCLLLASDGLFEGLENEKIHQIFKKWENNVKAGNAPLSQSLANSLVKELISEAGVKSNDNITVICAFFDN